MNGGDAEDARAELKKPFLHTGSWYRMNPNSAGKDPISSFGSGSMMPSRQSSLFGSIANMKESAISIVFCVFVVALGPIQFGFTVISIFFFLFFFSIFYFFGCLL